MCRSSCAAYLTNAEAWGWTDTSLFGVMERPILKGYLKGLSDKKRSHFLVILKLSLEPFFYDETNSRSENINPEAPGSAQSSFLGTSTKNGRRTNKKLIWFCLVEPHYFAQNRIPIISAVVRKGRPGLFSTPPP